MNEYPDEDYQTAAAGDISNKLTQSLLEKQGSGKTQRGLDQANNKVYDQNLEQEPTPGEPELGYFEPEFGQDPDEFTDEQLA